MVSDEAWPPKAQQPNCHRTVCGHDRSVNCILALIEPITSELYSRDGHDSWVRCNISKPAIRLPSPSQTTMSWISAIDCWRGDEKFRLLCISPHVQKSGVHSKGEPLRCRNMEYGSLTKEPTYDWHVACNDQHDNPPSVAENTPMSNTWKTIDCRDNANAPIASEK